MAKSIKELEIKLTQELEARDSIISSLLQKVTQLESDLEEKQSLVERISKLETARETDTVYRDIREELFAGGIGYYLSGTYAR